MGLGMVAVDPSKRLTKRIAIFAYIQPDRQEALSIRGGHEARFCWCFRLRPPILEILSDRRTAASATWDGHRLQSYCISRHTASLASPPGDARLKVLRSGLPWPGARFKVLHV